ncbi:MAG: bifunctional nitrate reductase/sulfite reductase flavoprotein subunit alpha [Pseudomonadota bacterium]
MTIKTSVKTVCPYCGVGCGMTLQVDEKRVVRVIGDKTHPANFGRLCTKGSTCSQAINESGRLDTAYIRKSRNQEPYSVAMDVAITETARRLREILDLHGPDSLALYVSGQMSLEAQYLANKLAKGFIGTNNVDSNSRLCMSSAASGYKLSLGADGPPGSYQDFDRTDLFFSIGANIADCHPILFLRLLDRVKAGAKLIVVDPRRTATAEKADLFLQIRPGTDLALLNGLLHLLVKNGHTDEAFIREFTDDWETMPAFLEDYTPEQVSEATGIPIDDLHTAARWIGEAGNWISCWTMGLNQSTHGTWHTNALCNLHLATGAICRPGSGPFSLTGQPNAMGGREVGYLSQGLPGQREVTNAADRQFMEKLWGIPHGSIQPEPGPDTVTLFKRMAAGEIRACWIICTNPVASVPNRSTVIAALEKAELVITQDSFLDTETNRYADILLPGALWAEAEGVMINSERNITLMQQAVEPPGVALPDWQIIARVACEMGFADAFSYNSASEVFDEIRDTWNPRTGYDIRGITHEKLRQGPLQWPCPPEAGDERHPIRYLNDGISQTLKVDVEGNKPRVAFPTHSGRARFIARPHLPPAELPDENFPLILNTGRLPHQWHTLTKTGKIATLNKLNPGPFVEINPQDALELGINAGDRMEVRSRRGLAVLPAVITDRVLPGNCFAPFHWNDVFGDLLAVNAVTSDAVDPISKQPEFKFCAVALERVEIEDAPVTLLDEIRALSHAYQMAEMAEVNAMATDSGKIEQLSSALLIPQEFIPVLNSAEQRYLSGFFTGLRERKDSGVPMLPPEAPFDADQRIWLNGLLAGLFSRVETPTNPLPITLLWASQTGNAETLAGSIATHLKARGWSPRLFSMADYDTVKLEKEQVLLLVSSTYGDGEPPDNGQRFWKFLKSEAAPQLSSLHYAVLALGDPSYDQFCGHGKNLDERLTALGASALSTRIDCDPDYHASVDAWLEQLYPQLQALAPEQTRLITLDSVGTKPTVPVNNKAKPVASRVLTNLKLNAAGATKETRYFSLAIGESGLLYEAGDALGVMPTNCPDLVAEILGLANLRADQPVAVEGVGELALADALTRHYEIARPSRDTLRFIADRSQKPELKTLLGADRKTELKDWLWGRQLADVLHDFPVTCAADELLSSLRRLQPRLYSISSSPKAHAGEVHLTVAAVRYRGPRIQRKGVSSTFLADRADGVDVPVFVQRSAHFRPPAKSDTPMIMVGPGTGVAPFRAFLHERRARGDSGQNWLFFGEQHSSTDFYYREELEAMRRDGLLTRLSLAFSRDQDWKIYVQDRMLEHGAELWRWLENGAHFYVCGDANRMAKDVDQALREVIQIHGGLPEHQAAEYVEQLSAARRYVRDVY